MKFIRNRDTKVHGFEKRSSNTSDLSEIKLPIHSEIVINKMNSMLHWKIQAILYGVYNADEL